MRLNVACATLFVLSASQVVAGDKADEEASKVIALTRQTKSSYSVFNWNIITQPGQTPAEEWAAEFHKGALHRVETPRDRVVADCEAGTGTHFQISTGTITSGPQVAKAACGIQANSRILEVRRLKSGNGRFGHTWNLAIKDSEFVRTYEVAGNGAIVGATISNHQSKILLRSFATRLINASPDNIFNESSLYASVTPQNYKMRP